MFRLTTVIGRSACLRQLGVAMAGAALCLSANAASVNAGTATANSRTALKIMVEDDAAPWSQADGSGAANDIVQTAFAAAGVEITLQTVPYARCKRMVVTGQIAACFGMSPDASLGDKVMLPDYPLYRNYSQYFHNPQHPLQAKSAEEIKPGAVVGIVSGYEYPPSVYELAQRGVILEAAGSETANLKKLAAGRLDATIAQLDEFKSVDFLTREAQVEGKVKPLFRSPEQKTYIGFSTLHPQGLWARNRFNEGFAKIRRDHSLQAIIDKWTARQRSQKANASAPLDKSVRTVDSKETTAGSEQNR